MSYQRQKYNTFEIFEDYMIGYDENKNRFLFDIDDYEKIKKVYWAKYKTDNYFRGTACGKHLWLHRYLKNAKNKEYVDHISNDKSDYRKKNLRICDNSENNRNRNLQQNNTSGCTGVDWDKRIEKWRARVKIYGKEKHIGSFQNLNDAIKARKDAETKYYGEFSYDRSQELNSNVY